MRKNNRFIPFSLLFGLMCKLPEDVYVQKATSYNSNSTFQVCFFLNLPVSSFNLDDNQKRWIVIGIGLNKVLLPPLRDVVAKEIPKHYAALQTAHKIDTQVYKNYLPKDGVSEFNYGSINSNWDCWKRKKASYNYNVSSAEELAKLYLEPKMAKFTGKKT